MVELEREGDRVTGIYPFCDGVISGAVYGDCLTGEWVESYSNGGLTFPFAPNGRSFVRRFANGEWWTGERAAGEPAADSSPAAVAAAAGQTVDLGSPKGALQTFMVAANRYRAGDYDAIAAGLAALDFGPAPWRMRTGERLAAAAALFRVLD